ncbi:Uncharacterised protein [Mycobacteroides abscessus subsp. bolletii]|uniref:Uncharacterized protein n=1 Tax=Mycobacteroides abscessus subsp. bolletii TaxID=319705 RepID=A0A9Q7SEP9_9MYCO|nr:hypothetical protein [Mycobacteroides abscessus]SHT85018.1 Uncharacterised protein [Mycobacteroides abscessus subsp. bolletii]SHU02648.1 Uncharacterised protein [Mycobacteroides abscessus subsp. bolletii]SHX42688.1 Uncharacterised protein [Mycobacteroides abscessus subsp. bolletii]SKM65311.1 Uncharacterised protein [Mycobacteroides abscessus subsp. bolletii]SKN39201.1 Uncharacterised protein [Mycobacteroides abscessus subsp. bolletii]
MSINIPEGFVVLYAIKNPDDTLAKHPFTGRAMVMTDRSMAERNLAQITEAAAQIGMTYTGRIVYQLCSPFIDPGDPIAETIGQIETWLKSQEGQS